MNNFNWKSFLFGSASVLTGISQKITKLANIVGISKQSDAINEVLFYGAQYKEKEQVGLNNLFCIYYMIAHASQSVDICVPTLESDTISKCLLNIQKRENNCAKVRIIVHNTSTLSNLQSFVSCGIQVKIIRPKIELEHEFLLIDANCVDAVAILGSLDYEVNRVNHNRDNTLITSEATLIRTLKREFNRIWDTEECIQLDKISRDEIQNSNESENISI